MAWFFSEPWIDDSATSKKEKFHDKITVPTSKIRFFQVLPLYSIHHWQIVMNISLYGTTNVASTSPVALSYYWMKSIRLEKRRPVRNRDSTILLNWLDDSRYDSLENNDRRLPNTNPSHVTLMAHESVRWKVFAGDEINICALHPITMSPWNIGQQNVTPCCSGYSFTSSPKAK